MPQAKEDIPTRLKRAAGELFAASGPDGTTVDEIARSAGVNRERVYAYFGGKDGLFATVLGDELLAIAEAVTLDAASIANIGTFTGNLFDYHTNNPRLQRLLQWEALLFGSRPVPDEVKRREQYQQKVDVIAKAQRDGTLSDEIPPGDLLFLLIAIAAWWSAVPQIMRMTEVGSPPPRRPQSASRERGPRRRAARPQTPRLTGAGPQQSADDRRVLEPGAGGGAGGQGSSLIASARLTQRPHQSRDSLQVVKACFGDAGG